MPTPIVPQMPVNSGMEEMVKNAMKEAIREVVKEEIESAFIRHYHVESSG